MSDKLQIMLETGAVFFVTEISDDISFSPYDCYALEASYANKLALTRLIKLLDLNYQVII